MIRILSVTLLLVLTLGLTTFVAAQPLSGLEYIAVTPCRVFDSRAGSPLPGGEITNIMITGRTCGIPADAVAADLNFTIVGPAATGHLSVFPRTAPPRWLRWSTSWPARLSPTRQTSSSAPAGPFRPSPW